MSYKEKAYENYVSTHIRPRKGTASLEVFKLRSSNWNRTLKRFVPNDENARIIDIGCGDGAIVWWLQDIGYRNTEGVDISREQVETAQGLGVRNIVQADIETYLIGKTGSYDLLILRDVLEHFPKERTVTVLELCKKALRDGGKVVIQVPNAMSPFFGAIRYGDITHEIAFSPAGIMQALSIAGFADVQIHSVGPFPGGIRATCRFILWKMVESLYRILLYAEIGRGKRIVTQNLIAVGIRGHEIH